MKFWKKIGLALGFAGALGAASIEKGNDRDNDREDDRETLVQKDDKRFEDKDISPEDREDRRVKIARDKAELRKVIAMGQVPDAQDDEPIGVEVKEDLDAGVKEPKSNNDPENVRKAYGISENLIESEVKNSKDKKTRYLAELYDDVFKIDQYIANAERDTVTNEVFFEVYGTEGKPYDLCVIRATDDGKYAIYKRRLDEAPVKIVSKAMLKGELDKIKEGYEKMEKDSTVDPFKI